MSRTVTLLLESGQTAELEPGDLIGRAHVCALRIDDGRISEVHAMISRRREGLALIALRGRVSSDGKPKTRVTLEPERRIILAGYYPIIVTAVTTPGFHPSVVEDGDSVRVPLGRVVSLRETAPPVAIFDPDAAGHVLGGRAGPRLRLPGRPDEALAPGLPFQVAGRTYRLVAASAAPFEHATSDRGQFEQGLRIVTRFDIAQITSDSGRSVNLDGLAARVISELAELKSPVAWTEFARILWNAPPDSATRHRWDQLLVRIRSKLREAGIRGDLVRSNRNGLVELVLGPNDKLQVRT